MYTDVMEITPSQAAEFLRLNITNRPIRKGWVKTLEDVILRDEWQVTHQGIAISAENRLLDGQHRLQAIVNTKRTVLMNVSFDCDESTFQVIDSGVKRTTGDHLGVSAHKTAVAKLVWRLPRPREKPVPSAEQIRALLDWADEPIEAVLKAAPARNKFASAGILVAVAAHVMAGRDEVLPKLQVFASANFDAMTPSMKAFYKQIAEAGARGRKDPWDLPARAWRAFDPGSWDVNKIIVKDTDVAIAAMFKAVEVYRKRQEKMKEAA